MYIDKTISIFYISATWDYAIVHSFFSMLIKKVFQNFQKLLGLWLVGDVVIYVGIYGYKAVEGWSAFRRRSCFLLIDVP